MASFLVWGRMFVSIYFDKGSHLDGCLAMMSCSLTIHSVRIETARRWRKKKEAGRGTGEWDGKRRGGVWLSLVQVNERWKYKEAVWGCGGSNREDWQKQSSSTLGCLNLQCCCYTPSTPHQSPLMTSNITQSFVIAWNQTGTVHRDLHYSHSIA